MNMRINHVVLLFAIFTATSCQKKLPATTGSLATHSKAGMTGFPDHQLTDIYDRVIPYDFNGTGVLDHLLCYRPGSAAGEDNVTILEKTASYTYNTVWSSVNNQPPLGIGIGGYNLTNSPASSQDAYNEVGGDHILPFDGLSNGHQDYLIVYRPGTGLVWILQHLNGVYAPIFESSTGIGGCDLSNVNDKIIAFDYNSTGKKDHLVIYRPGTQNIWIIENRGNSYNLLVHGVNGIAGFDLAEVTDQCIAFDADNSGKEDHLLLYRPGIGTNAAIWLAKHVGPGVTFTTQFSTHSGLPNFNLSMPQDRIIAYDYNGIRHNNQLLAYRSGGGVGIYNFNSSFNGFNQLYFNSSNIGGYNMLFFPVNGTNSYSGTKLVNFDAGDGRANSTLLAYCPGPFADWTYILTNNPTGTFNTAY